MKLFSVHDSKAEAYGVPFCSRSTGEAIRDFQTASNDPKSYVSKHPEDYTLFEIGEFDEFSGILTPTGHKAYGKALDYIKQPNNVYQLQQTM